MEFYQIASTFLLIGLAYICFSVVKYFIEFGKVIIEEYRKKHYKVLYTNLSKIKIAVSLQYISGAYDGRTYAMIISNSERNYEYFEFIPYNFNYLKVIGNIVETKSDEIDERRINLTFKRNRNLEYYLYILIIPFLYLYTKLAFTNNFFHNMITDISIMWITILIYVIKEILFFKEITISVLQINYAILQYTSKPK